MGCAPMVPEAAPARPARTDVAPGEKGRPAAAELALIRLSISALTVALAVCARCRRRGV